MLTVGSEASGLRRTVRATLAESACGVFAALAALVFLTMPVCAAESSLPQPDLRAASQAQARKEAPGPLLAAAQTGRQVATRAPQAMLPSRVVSPNLSLLPYLDYLLDESSSLDIEEAAAPDRAPDFAPLALEKLPRAEGVMWLRFRLAPLTAGERPSTLLLDMGQSIPGTPMLYEPERNDLSGALEWRESSPAQRNVLLLPEAGPEPITCYIRLDGLPGLWFSPVVRTPADAATNWGSLARTGAILALGVVMLLCLLRGLSENGQWRIWTGLYVAVALVQALLGMPEGGAPRPSLGQAAATLSPGLALMLLPHVGRHLMRTRDRARGLDIQLLLLSLPGAALAVLPLVPGWAWLDRWLDLWPAATLLFVPTALGAWLAGLGGARRFLLGCLLPPLFVGGGILGLDFGVPANLLASAPLWGVALSALLIAATGAPADMAASQPELAANGRHKSAAEKDESGIIALEHPLDDPNLRLIPGGKAESDLQSGGLDSGLDLGAEALHLGTLSAERTAFEAREAALRVPLDDLLREGAALEQCALPPAVRQYAADMLAAARRMADVLSHAESGRGQSQEDQQADEITAFDLQWLLREVHGAVAPVAEYAGIGLSWYMPPHLGQLYRGDARALSDTLDLLLESAVRATRQGAVHLSARRVPESSDVGNILFTVTDSGTGAPPRERSSLALARAWELAARHGGYVGMEYGPNGTTIAFSLHLEPLEDSAEEMAGETLPHVIIVAEDAAQRRKLARMTGDLPCRCSEAVSEHEALRRHEADPAVLLLTQGRYARPAAADMVNKFLSIATEAGLSGCKVLAVTEDDSQWNLLAGSGFTHALLEPVDAEALRQTVRDVIRNASFTRPMPQKAAPAEAEREAEAKAAPAGESGGDSAPAGDVAPVEASSAEAGEETRQEAQAAPSSSGAVSEVAAGMPETAEASPEEAQPSAPAEAIAPATEAAEPQEKSQAKPESESVAELESEPAAEPVSEPAAELIAEPVAEQSAEPVAEIQAAELSDEEWEFLLAPPEPGPAEAETGPQAAAAEPEISAPEEAGPQPAPDADQAPLGEAEAPEPQAAEEVKAEEDFFMTYAMSASPVAEMSNSKEVPAPEPSPAAPLAWPEAANADMPPDAVLKPRFEARRAEAAPREEAPKAASAWTSVYVSPSLATPGEWVGEPMPIGTPLPRREEPRPELRREENRRLMGNQGQPVQSSYTSPSVPVPGEWVGEPMPIPRKPPEEKFKAEPEPEDKTAPAQDANVAGESVASGLSGSLSASQEAVSGQGAASGEAGSLMDFIVSAKRVAAPEAPNQARPPQEKAPGGMTDFVETSLSLVSSAVSSAFQSAAPAASNPASNAGCNPACNAETRAASVVESASAVSRDASSPDAVILGLVQRLDAAMKDASAAHAAGRTLMVAQAAAVIAEESESFGFRVLARMARCVERAGRAGDMNALKDLLPELAVSVERNRIALTQHK